MKTVEYRGRMLQVPTQLEEFTPAQYRRYLEISLMNDRGVLSRPALRAKLLTLLLDERTDISLLKKKAAEEALGLISLTAPFVHAGKERDTLRLDTTRNLLPRWEGWDGPGDLLDGMLFGDFIDCHTLLKLMQKAGSPGRTEQLASEFCRKVYRNAEKPGAEPDEILCAHALLFFHNAMKSARHEPLEVNGEEIDLSILFGKPDRRKPDDRTGWTGTALEIAETGTFGTYREVLATPLWDILLFLYRKKFEHLYRKK